MTSRTKSAATMVTCGAALAFGAWALGTGVGDGQSDAATTRNVAHTGPAPGFRMHHLEGPGLAPLARRLGVSETTLQTALGAVMRERRAAREARVSAALAKALGLPRAKVAAALEKAAPMRDADGPRLGFARRLAAALGTSPEKVRAALRTAEGAGGDRFGALASALGVSETKLRSALMSAMPRPGHGFRAERRAHLAALAKDLGVSEAKLRTALRGLRGTLRPPAGEGLAAALAKELGLPTATVRSALRASLLRFGMHRGFEAPMGRPPGDGGPPPMTPGAVPGPPPGAPPPGATL